MILTIWYLPCLHKLKQVVDSKGNSEQDEGGSNVFHKSPPLKTNYSTNDVE